MVIMERVCRWSLVLLMTWGVGLGSARAAVPPDPCGIIADKLQKPETRAALLKEARDLVAIHPSMAAEKYLAACLASDYQTDFVGWMEAATQLSESLSQAHRHKEAVAVATEIQALATPEKKGYSSYGHHAYVQLAGALFRSGKPAEAEEVLRRGLRDKALDNDLHHPAPRTLLHELAACLALRNKPGEAEPLLRSLEQQGHSAGQVTARDAEFHEQILHELGKVLRLQGKWDEAEKAYRESIVLQGKLGPLNADREQIFESTVRAYVEVLQAQNLSAAERQKRLAFLKDVAANLQQQGERPHSMMVSSGNK